MSDWPQAYEKCLKLFERILQRKSTMTYQVFMELLTNIEKLLDK